VLTGRHRAVAEIDLEAIRHNVRRLMRDLPNAAVHCAVVKADGYGHGAVATARTALEAGSTWLGLATAPEAEEMREAGLTAPALVFGPLTGTGLERAANAGAEVVAWSAPFLAEAVRRRVRVHIKFDTGMHRLGVPEAGVRELCAQAHAAEPPSFSREVALERLEGDENFLRELIEIFLKDAPERIEKLDEALRAGEAAQVQLHAHTLKGASAYLGAEALREAAYEMELAGKAGDLAQAPQSLRRIEYEYGRLKKDLQALAAAGCAG
jgi:HPt (histidine-containing phosphotransfer) domain-containing protein